MKKKNSIHNDDIKLIKEMFNLNFQNLLDENTSDNGDLVLTELNFKPEMMKRRILASKKFLPKIYSEFSFKYSSIPFSSFYIGLISLPTQGTRCIDDVYFPFLGAVIWLLDYFVEHNMLTELTNILPKEYNELDYYQMPIIKDSIHPQNLINKVITIIMERDDTCKDCFNKMLKLVNEKDVLVLKKSFEKNILSFIEGYLKYVKINREKMDNEIKPLIEELKIFENSELKERVLKAKRTEMFYENLLDRYVALEAEFLTEGLLYLSQSKKAIIKRFGEDATEILLNFGSGNPYEICAAYLFLNAQDDDLRYLTLPTAATVFYAVCRLPWNNRIDVNRFNAEFTPISYDLIYQNTESVSTDTLMYNYPQILFNVDNRIMPRDMQNAEINHKFLSDFNISTNVANNIFTTNYLLESLSKRYSFNHNDDDCIERNLQNELENTKTIEEIKVQNTVLLAKLNEMQIAFLEERRANNKLKNELVRQQERVKAEHEEYISLRDALFKLQSNFDEHEPEVSKDIVFPFETQRNICVFGGHETWIKSIKPLMPNVRFIGRNINPHPNLIKNADIIWLQTNSMSHAYFYQIINMIRKYNVSCRYFGYASAQKCAEQIIKEEIQVTCQ